MSIPKNMNPEDLRGLTIVKKPPTLVYLDVLRCLECGTDFETPHKDNTCPYCHRRGRFKKLSEIEVLSDG